MGSRRTKLSWKLAGVVTLGIAFVHSISAYLRVEREVTRLETEMRRDHASVAHALGVSATSTSTRAGTRASIQLLEDADFEIDPATIRWVPRDVEPTRPRAGVGFVAGSLIELDAEERVLVTTLPLDLAGETGVLEIRESLAAEDDYVRDTVVRAALTTLFLVLLCLTILIAAGWVFVERPMKALLAKVQRIGDGDLSGPLALEQRDELGALGGALDMMCEELQQLQADRERETQAKVAALEQLRHAERLSTVGQLASGIAHELGTPLNVVSAKAKMIVRGQSLGDDAVRDAGIVVDQTERMTKIIRQLLDFARRRKPNRERVDLAKTCEQTLRVLEPLAKKGGVELSLAPTTVDATAEVDAAQIQQVLTNLVMNGVQAQPAGGVVRVSIHEPPSGTEGEVCITVEDDGEGMAEDVRDQVFEPFFTTKEVGRGTGLGLSVAYGIVTEHGGLIDVDSSPGKGSRFTVRLPRRSS